MLNDFKLYHVKLKLYIYIILNTCLSIACFVFWYDNQWDITGPIFVIKAIPDFVSEWPLLVGEVGVHVKKKKTVPNCRIICRTSLFVVINGQAMDV